MNDRMSKLKRKVPDTIGELLFWNYANLAIAYSAS